VNATPVLPARHQDLANHIWAEIISACDAYFARGERAWAGDSRAPELPDDAIERQFAHWDAYRTDHGAMHWRANGTKQFAYDFTALPAGWKRAICERVWALCLDAGLHEDPDYAAASAALAARPE
jgi:hypothetical protein